MDRLASRAFRRHSDGGYPQVLINYPIPTQGGLLRRFHKTRKAEFVCRKLDASPGEVQASQEVFRRWHNVLHPHWAPILPAGSDALTPADVYVAELMVELANWQGLAKAVREKLEAMNRGIQFPFLAESQIAG